MSYQQNPARHNRSNPHRLNNQRGVVIVIALFIIALVATMSYVMMARLSRDTDRTALLLHNAQSEAYARGSVAWAMDVLQTNAQEGRRDRLIDVLPLKSAESVVDGYKIQSTIEDMQARLNLNSLSNKNYADVFKRLLIVVDPKMSAEQRDDLMVAILDWLKPEANNEELDKYYIDLPLSYRAAHAAMQNPSELLLVKGMTPKLYTALQPYIITLPVATPLNVQTMPAPLLTALSDTMTLSAAQTVVRLREQAPFNSKEDFTDLEIIKDKNIHGEILTNLSQYFLVETKVAKDQQKLVLYTLLERDEGKIKILWQSKGIW